MQARMKHPALVIPEAMATLQALSGLAERSGLSRQIVELVHLRCSQINGCGVCVDMHWRFANEAGEPQERLFTVAAWRDASYFTAAERAALALAEAMTRLSDRSDPVPDDIWNAAAQHFNERELAGLVLAIATINVWNRLNVATRQIAGEWVKQYVEAGARA